MRLSRLTPLLSVVLFAAAAWALHGVLQGHALADVVAHLDSLSSWQVAAAIALTLASYLMLTGYEALAMRHVDCRLSYPKVALGSFVSYVFAHNIGVSMLTGGTVRYRIYSAEGLSAVDIAVITLLCTINFALGSTLLVGLALLIEPSSILSGLELPIPLLRAAGVACLVLIAGYLIWTSTRRRPIRLREWEVQPPSLFLSLAQIGLSVLDIAAAAAALFVLSPLPDAGISFLAFLGVFTLAIVAGVISHVPGGLGVVETVVILLLPEQPAGSLFAALIAFRGIYYVVPLLIGALLLVLFEARAHRERLRRAATVLSAMVERLVPPVLALLTMVAGTVLLFSGATPAVDARLAWLSEFLPLQVVEGSHLLGSLTGLGLIVLARAMARRLDAACHLAMALLAAGIVFSLLKGLDYEEAIFMAAILATLFLGRRAFYRRASILAVRFEAPWIVTLLVLIGTSIWLGLFSYKHVGYSHDLWWQFAFDADAPRFLRASFVVCIAAAAFAAYRLLRPAKPEPQATSAEDLRRVRGIVVRSPASAAALALLGDKRFLFSDSGRSFVMYGVQGSSWISCGDPVGESDEWSELLWAFRETCDRHGGRTVLYEVSKETLPFCIELGLSLFKIGEEGRIRLSDFSLEGSRRKELRYIHRRAQKDGLSFEVLATGAVAPEMPQLRAISDAWLAQGKKGEKGFSLGAFAPDYLLNFPCAVVRQGGAIVAFANVWCGADREECSIDLMRYGPEAPRGVMDYLFIELMLWGRGQGYGWFSLGMAPLSGLAEHPLAPMWNRLGTLIFRNGENFYNFEGLRRYKEKFHPEWQPRYLACPSGLAVAPALIDVSTLIARGVPA
jgi:phosphatidylglycerol lysyltransferase